MAILTSSAGRLLKETRRIVPALSSRGDRGLYEAIEAAFSAENFDWTRGVGAYRRLVDRCLVDLTQSQHPNPDRFIEAVSSVGQLCQPSRYGMNTGNFLSQFVSEIALERLLGADEVLQLRDLQETYSEDHAQIALDGIAGILDLLSSEPPSEVRDFLERQLIELRTVLERYLLFGPEGVQDVVGQLIGGLFMRQVPILDLPPSTRKIITEVYGVIKAALGVAVWSKETIEALTWASEKLHLLPGQ